MKLKDILSGKPLTEAKSAKALRSDYDKAVKKEQALSSLLLVNLQKYKDAKAKGDEKAIAKHTKIAGDLGKKKKTATTNASDAYKAYEDKISGLHADAELELKETSINERPITRAKVDYSNMDLRSNIDVKWTSTDDMADDLSQWVSAVLAASGPQTAREIGLKLKEMGVQIIKDGDVDGEDRPAGAASKFD